MKKEGYSQDQCEDLLGGIFAENSDGKDVSVEAGSMDAMLQVVRRRNRRRTVVRQGMAAATAAMVVLLGISLKPKVPDGAENVVLDSPANDGFQEWSTSSALRLVGSRYQVVESIDTATDVVSSEASSAVEIVRTVNSESVREITDAELLEVFAGQPALLLEENNRKTFFLARTVGNDSVW